MEDSFWTVVWRVSMWFLLVVVFQVAVAQVSIFQNQSKEAKRRWQHAITGHLLVQISYILPLSVSIGALLVGASGIAYLCYCQPTVYLQHFGPLLRAEETTATTTTKSSKNQGVPITGRLRLPGAFYFLIGTALTAWMFPLTEARYAVECLALADPMAAWMGQVIESPKFHAKASWSGCTACFVTAYVTGLLFLNDQDSDKDETRFFYTTFLRPMVGALACTIAEAMPWGNDNLLIPLITGAAVTFVVPRN